MKNYEEICKELGSNDFYPEEIDGENDKVFIIVHSYKDNELAMKILEDYDADEGPEIETIFDEQIERCDECGRIYYKERDYGFYGEYGFTCQNCIDNNDAIKDDILEYLTDNEFSINRGNLSDDFLKKQGFSRDENTYSCGLYPGCNGIEPGKIIKKAQNEHKYVVFSQEGDMFNPFLAEIACWYKPWPVL